MGAERSRTYQKAGWAALALERVEPPPPVVGPSCSAVARSRGPPGEDADRAPGDEGATPVLGGGLDQPLRPQHVDLEEIDPAPARLDLAGAVVDHVHALHGPLQRRPLAEV